MGQDWESWHEMDVYGIEIPRDDTPAAVMDARSEALGIIERGGRTNEEMAPDLAALGFRAIGGKLVPIDTEDSTA